MAFVNEFVTQGDRDKYFSKYEILEKNYPRDWTIDKDRESILFLRSREREDMYSDELRDKYVKHTANFHNINYIALTKFIFFTKFK